MKTFLLLAALTVSPLLMAAVGNQDLQDIRGLIEAGKYEEALQKHLWFHEESKTSTGMGGVRLSFALSQWVRLGGVYPKALVALKELRDGHEQNLLAGKAGFSEFHEVSAINRELKEDQKTHTLFKQLHAKHPAIAKRCFDVSLDLLVKNGDYELCGEYLGNPIPRYERLEEMRERNRDMMEKNPRMNTSQFRNYTDGAFTKKTAQLIDILAHLKRTDEAREIQKRALAYFASPEIEKALPAP